jgi:hypothetical protein
MHVSDIAHVLFGLLASLLNQEWLFTAIYLFYQLVDLIGGESPEEVKRDIVEYALGLLVGLFVRLLHSYILSLHFYS